MEERRTLPFVAQVEPRGHVVPGTMADIAMDAADGDEHRMLAERHFELFLQEQHRSWVEIVDLAFPVVFVLKDSQGFGSYDHVAQK